MKVKASCMFVLSFYCSDCSHHEFCGVWRPHSGWWRRHHLPEPRLHDACQGSARRPNADPLWGHSPFYRPDRSALRVEDNLQQRWLGVRAPSHAGAVDRLPSSPHTDPLHHRHFHHHHDAGAEAGLHRLRVRWVCVCVEKSNSQNKIHYMTAAANMSMDT